MHSAFKYERPNAFLYNFVGSMWSVRAGMMVGLDHSNFVLRGCSLRNTKWIIGIVAYTGYSANFVSNINLFVVPHRKDTKIMLNSVKSRPKKSKVDKTMNNQIILVFIAQILISLFAAIWADIWLVHKTPELPYFDIQSGDVEADYRIYILVNYGTWILLLSYSFP